jgi:LAO/AO transport system kinase
MSLGPADILKGNPRALARHLRGLDDGTESAFVTQRALLKYAGKAQTIGITGSPGAGKSTLTDKLITHYRAGGQSVAVLAVDPSSPFSGGAILGDRIRMQASHGDRGVFVRSVATRGALGGLSASIRDMVDAMDAASFDIIIIETVGVGQDEIDIVNLAQTNVVLSLPGTGDGVQAIKAGLLEIADIFVVNKSDRAGADQAASQLQFLLDIEGHTRHGWTVPVLLTNAVKGEGLQALAGHIDEHYIHLSGTEEGARRREAFRETALREALRSEISITIQALLSTSKGREALGALKRQDEPARDIARRLLDACGLQSAD